MKQTELYFTIQNIVSLIGLGTLGIWFVFSIGKIIFEDIKEKLKKGELTNENRRKRSKSNKRI